MGIIQNIKSILIPEVGLDLEPEFVKEIKVGTDFSRVLAHLVARAGSRSVILKATTDGRLHVAWAGTSMEVYIVEMEVATPDVFDGGSTHIQVLPIYTTDILIETNDATIQFYDVNGNWGDNISLPVGFHSRDFVHYGIRIQNRVALAVGAYEIVMYR